jgi:acetyl esterase/lipase
MRSFDPEIAAALQASSGQAESWPDVWDVAALRAQAERFYLAAFAALPDSTDVARTDVELPAGGAALRARWYVPPQRGPGPAVVYLHGGGLVAGSVALHDPAVGWYARESGVPFLAVDYRLAPEHPGEQPAEDGFAGLGWLVAHAAELGVDPRRIAVMGDSAGGGIAAGVAILARDRGVPLTRQLLVYPMLDDRTLAVDPQLEPFAIWTPEMNAVGWRALLGEAAGGPSTSGVAAPARQPDLTGLADAYVEVGDLDLFRDEAVEYAQRLARAGAAVELHVHPGAPHGYDWFAPASALADRWRADRLRVLRTL